ncbi:hypothetical protein D3C87_1962800 [compost metagenome]
MGIRQFAPFQNTDAVAEERERSLRRNARIQLAQRPCRRISRVGENFSARTTRFVVDLLKALLREENFTTHFKTRGNIVTTQR